MTTAPIDLHSNLPAGKAGVSRFWGAALFGLAGVAVTMFWVFASFAFLPLIARLFR